MDVTLRIVLLVASVLFLAFVLFRIRRGKYLLKYSLIWIALSLLGVISSIFPEWIVFLAHVAGFSVPSNFVYFALIILLLISNLILCGILSRQETTIKSVVQELSILKSESQQSADGVEHAEHSPHDAQFAK